MNDANGVPPLPTGQPRHQLPARADRPMTVAMLRALHGQAMAQAGAELGPMQLRLACARCIIETLVPVVLLNRGVLALVCPKCEGVIQVQIAEGEPIEK